MGKTYEKAPQYCLRLLGPILSKYHPELAEAELKVDMLIVRAPRDADGNPTGPALQAKSGFPAAACISVTKLKERVLGRGDCEIQIDGDRYRNWDESRLIAILDHELEHLEYTGNVDDCGRPKLRLRPHDVEFGWFDSVARRHGDNSVEVVQAKQFFGARPLRQLYLPGWEDGVPVHEADSIRPSISRAKAAKEIGDAFACSIDPKTLVFCVIPIIEDDQTRTVETWSDPLERAVIFSNGEVIETTPQLQLSARWVKGGADES